MWPHGLQHTRLLCLPSPRICSNSSPLSWWYYPTILFSAAFFSFCLQSFPATGSFLMIQLFASTDQNIEALASASVLSMNIQGWFLLWLTGLISLQSKGLSRVCTIRSCQFFGAQSSLWSNSHIHTWLLEKPQLWLDGSLSAKWSLLFNILSRSVIAFLPRSKHLLISWLQSPSTVFLEPN